MKNISVKINTGEEASDTSKTFYAPPNCDAAFIDSEKKLQVNDLSGPRGFNGIDSF